MTHGQLDLFDPGLTHPTAPRARRGRKPRRNELLDVARLALVVARRELNDYACPKSKHTFTQPQLLACLVLRAYKKLTYRGTVELLDASDALRATLGLTHAPAHTTLKEFERRVVTPALLDRLVGAVLALLVEQGLVVREVAVDSTGVETSGASAHFRTRAKRQRKGYVKLSMCVACTSILLVSLAVSMGPSNDLGDGAREVLWRAAPRCRPDRVVADGGYDAEWFHTWCRGAWDATSHVPPVPRARDGTVKGGPDRVRCAAHTPLNYGRRWHVESFISGMKRTCGSTLAARGEAALFNEAGLKALAYAVRR
jgi:hypothetical protein